MNKKAYAFFLKKNRPQNKQNPIAEELSDGRYQPVSYTHLTLPTIYSV